VSTEPRRPNFGMFSVSSESLGRLRLDPFPKIKAQPPCRVAGRGAIFCDKSEGHIPEDLHSATIEWSTWTDPKG
jgi:hypothetical protein